jgi:hypothetical protein
MTNAETFLALYKAELAVAVRKTPAEYMLRPGETPDVYADRVAEKMVTTIQRGSSVNVSKTMKRAARILGINPQSNAAIYKFIRENE